MAIELYPHTLGGGNNVTLAQWEAMFSKIMGDGVNKLDQGGLVTTAGSGLSSNVATGSGFLHGHFFNNDAIVNLVHTPSGTNPKIDLIVAHADLQNDSANAISIIAGTPSGTPVPPTVTQSATVWEIPLYQVLVPTSAASSAAFTYTDVRASAIADIPAGSIATSMIAAGAITDALMANPKVNRAGDTMTGALVLNQVLGGGNQNYVKIAPSDGATYGLNENIGASELVFFDYSNNRQVASWLSSRGLKTPQALGMYRGPWALFSGSGSGTYSHGLGTTPNHVNLAGNFAGTMTGPSWDSPTSTQVHVTCGAASAFTAEATVLQS